MRQNIPITVSSDFSSSHAKCLSQLFKLQITPMLGKGCQVSKHPGFGKEGGKCSLSLPDGEWASMGWIGWLLEALAWLAVKEGGDPRLTSCWKESPT